MSGFDDGSSGQVYNEAYCMKESVEAKNNAEMNQKMGYFNMADLANTKAFPVQMTGEKQNRQLGPEAADENYNYNADR